MESSESQPNSFNENYDKVKQRLIEELEERITNPNVDCSVTPEVFNTFLATGKIVESKEVYELFCKIGQDFRVNPNQLQAIRQEMFI